jgi:putative ABC transport system permease protein
VMPASKLVRMVVKNTARSPRHFALSAFGIVIGIAAFVFFLALSLGVRQVVLGKIFPLDVIEVTRPRTTLAGANITLPINDDTVAEVKKNDDVADALPRMRALFPAIGNGSFSDTPITFEVGGNTDGIDPSFLANDPKLGPLFQDWDADPAPRQKCLPPELGYMIYTDAKKALCPHELYCDMIDLTCHKRVPVIVSQTMIELYNGQVAAAHGLPSIGDMESFMLEHAGDRLSFEIHFGESMITDANPPKGARPRIIVAQMIGLSNKAMPIGMTVPIGYVRRWNREFNGEQAANSYSSIIVTLKDKDRLAPFTGWLEDDDGPDDKPDTADDGPGLRVQDPIGVKFATAIFIVTTLFIFISFTIVSISSINIAHNFFMQVSDRRREIGLLRALGATRTDVKLIILGEAGLIGLIGGVLGIVISFLGALLVDWASATYLPPFPFKPATYFDFEPWIVGLGVGFSTLFCIIGGWLPARKASRLQPAQALAQQ